MINVLVVEDSPVVREFLLHILGTDPAIRVVGTAQDGEQAIEAVRHYRPDVVTMDIHMPRMDGIEATRRIMETEPVPIVIVSGSTDPHDVAITFRATEAGALAVLRRPAGIGHPEHETNVTELIQTIKLMAEVKLVRRWSRQRREATAVRPPDDIPARASMKASVVALGASTGGPPVLQTILAGLPQDFSLPVLIVQHMSSGFVQGFAEWLAQSSALPVQLAAHDMTILPGQVYVAPDNFHMKVAQGGRVVLSKEAPEGGLRPAVACLFRSLAEVYGADAVAVLLTGMGRDGAEELKLLRDSGALTIAQDKDSSVVHGMPGEAIKLNAAQFILPPEKIALLLVSLTFNRNKGVQA